jgi:hypothetical protein
VVPFVVAAGAAGLEEVAEDAVVGREVVAVAAELGVDSDLRAERPILEAWAPTLASAAAKAWAKLLLSWFCCAWQQRLF